LFGIGFCVLWVRFRHRETYRFIAAYLDRWDIAGIGASVDVDEITDNPNGDDGENACDHFSSTGLFRHGLNFLPIRPDNFEAMRECQMLAKSKLAAGTLESFGEEASKDRRIRGLFQQLHLSVRRNGSAPEPACWKILFEMTAKSRLPLRHADLIFDEGLKPLNVRRTKESLQKSWGNANSVESFQY